MPIAPCTPNHSVAAGNPGSANKTMYKPACIRFIRDGFQKVKMPGLNR
jgi:hypothetical protein